MPNLRVRVLVVDDNQDAALSMALLLEMWGHTVRVARSGLEAINVALAEPPDAILLAIGLPGMDGYEAARQLRSNTSLRATRLIALSAFGREEDKRRAMEAGFDLHLTKPAEEAALQAALTGPF
jgi:CheY-like chemotaxis protein